MSKSIIAIPLGDVAGIGPEIVVKALNNPEIYEIAKPLVIGHSVVLSKAMKICNMNLNINKIEDPLEGVYTYGTIDLIELDCPKIEEIESGKVQKEAGEYAFNFIKKSVELALAKKVHSLATTPINKEALRAANVPYIGHTEILGGLCNVENPLTMFQVKNLRVLFLTRHLSLMDAIKSIKRDMLYEHIKMDINALRALGIADPNLAVAALNPHGGEHGLFGNEEMEEISPAIEMAQKEGLKVSGPVPADSVFYMAMQGKYDAVLSLYHDQGHIATKMVDFERTISLTLGLPFLRTSVDHGTAFDIAGKGIASSVSMEEAIRLAAQYAPTYRYKYLK
ncbi:MAG: 4-hydroxythreonine-4-phosphate dehydrogenase PdxA [Thermoanaerobacteraceae bacterium]|nr:4-hydroxythreonine-4-phosphate dehydrogenase PdxA [Thermoanaerobacteraceae bacterium]